MSKLETLVNVLRAGGVEEGEINKIIIDNYADPNTSDFTVGDVEYIILTTREVDELLDELAENRFESYKEDLEEDAWRKGSHIYAKMIDTIKEEKCFDFIREEMNQNDIATHYEADFLMEEDGYFIFTK